MQTQKSYLPKKVERKWVEIDVSSKTLGRIATQIANILRGKDRRYWTPHLDLGDFVVAINVGKIKLTGKKIEQKVYHHYSGYPGGVRTKTLKNMIVDHPEDVLRRAVFSMIDDMKLRKPMMRRLKMVVGDKHEYKVDRKVNQEAK